MTTPDDDVHSELNEWLDQLQVLSKELDFARPLSSAIMQKEEKAIDYSSNLLSSSLASTSGSLTTTTMSADRGARLTSSTVGGGGALDVHQQKVKPVVPPKPPIDSFRYSMANIQECADVDLDVLLGELCALESQLNDNSSSPRCYKMTTKITINNNAANTNQHHPAKGAGGLCGENSHHRAMELLNCRSHSPDNDSAFCDSLSLMSAESSAMSTCNGHRSRDSNASSADSTRGSLTTPSPTQLTESVQTKIKNVQEEMKKENLTDEEQSARLKAEKIKIALEKMKEASVRKLYVKFFSSNCSSKNILIDERWTVSYILRHLADKNRVALTPNHAIVEHYPDLHMERIYEDHEHLVENILLWSRDSSNKLYFVDRRDKCDIFYNPEVYLCAEQKPTTFDVLAKRRLLEEYFGFSHSQPPEVEGVLYLKTEGKKVWKKHYFVLRSSGLYYVPKGKSKSSKDLVCLMQLDTAQIYNGVGWKKKYKAPTDYGFALKHPQIQVKASRFIKYLCVDDEKTYLRWMTGLRLAKNGKQLYDNYESVQTYLESDEAKFVDSKLPTLDDNSNSADYCKQSVVMRPRSGGAQQQTTASPPAMTSSPLSISAPHQKSALSAALSVDAAQKDRPRSADIVRSGSVHGNVGGKRGSRQLITVDAPLVPVVVDTSWDKPICNGNGSPAAANNRRNTAPCCTADGPLLILSSDTKASTFDADAPRTSTIKKQPASTRPSAHLPLTESVRHIHSVSMRFYNNQQRIGNHGNSNGSLGNNSIDSSTCSVDSKGSTETEETDDSSSDEDLPLPPPRDANADVDAQSVCAFPPPPSPLPTTLLLLNDDADDTGRARQDASSTLASNNAVDASSLTHATNGKKPAPPKPKRSESTRLTTSLTSNQIYSATMTSSSADHPMDSTTAKLRLSTSTVGTNFTSGSSSVAMATSASSSSSSSSTNNNAFHDELQRAMSRRLQQLERNMSTPANHNSTPAHQNLHNTDMVKSVNFIPATSAYGKPNPPALPPKKLLSQR